MSWFYLSFASEAGFLGAIWSEAPSKDDALAKVTLAGINPGGECIAWGPLTAADMDTQQVPASARERLVTPEELSDLFGEKLVMGCAEDFQAIAIPGAVDIYHHDPTPDTEDSPS